MINDRRIEGFILAAGLGTRMGPLSQVLPKPAWTLRNKPLLLWGAECLRRHGIHRLACNAHHLPEKILEVANSEIEVCMEPQLLGSAGGLHHVIGRAVDPLAVWNGDAFADVPWTHFISEHKRQKASLSWLLVPHNGGPWNQVWLDEDNRVAFIGHLNSPGLLKGPFHFTGATLWSHEALALLPEGPSDVKMHIIPRLNRHLGIVVEPLQWFDISSPDHLISTAENVAPQEEGRLPSCYIHPTATPGGILKRCILGPGVNLNPAITDENALWFMEGNKQVRVWLD